MKLSKSKLRKMGFSDGMIDYFLPPPEIVPNPEYWKKNGVFKLWEESEVKEVMKTPEFKAARNDHMISRNNSASLKIRNRLDEMRRCGETGYPGELEDLTERLAFLEREDKELRRNHKKYVAALKIRKGDIICKIMGLNKKCTISYVPYVENASPVKLMVQKTDPDKMERLMSFFDEASKTKGGITLRFANTNNIADVCGLYVKDGAFYTLPKEAMRKAYTTCSDCGEYMPVDPFTQITYFRSL